MSRLILQSSNINLAGVVAVKDVAQTRMQPLLLTHLRAVSSSTLSVSGSARTGMVRHRDDTRCSDIGD